MYCENFSHCFGKVGFPIVQSSETTTSMSDALSCLSQQLSEDNEILKLQKEILEDELFLTTLNSYAHLPIKEQLENTKQYFNQAFSQLDSTYFQERLKDILDVCNMLYKIIFNTSVIYPRENCILYVEEITPYEILHLPENIRGIIIKHNSMHTHTSILLKERNIPFVNGVEVSEKNVTCLFYNNQFFVNPNHKELEDYYQYKENLFDNLENTEDAPIFINLSSLNFPEFNYREIGLFRTEMMALKMGRIPTEEEMYEYYKKLDVGKPIRIRLFDFGDDKKIDNSGFRGFEWLCFHHHILHQQLRAILKVNSCNFKILIPMIRSVFDYYFVKNMAREICEEEGYNMIPIGVMIENYSAVHDLQWILPEVSFVNVGTNDLIADWFNTTRENPQYDKDKFLIVLREIIRYCSYYNVPMCICGEIVNEIGIDLLRMGADSISVNISNYKELIKHV